MGTLRAAGGPWGCRLHWQAGKPLRCHYHIPAWGWPWCCLPKRGCSGCSQILLEGLAKGKCRLFTSLPSLAGPPTHTHVYTRSMHHCMRLPVVDGETGCGAPVPCLHHSSGGRPAITIRGKAPHRAAVPAPPPRAQLPALSARASSGEAERAPALPSS